jgi:hypothetical protein
LALNVVPVPSVTESPNATIAPEASGVSASTAARKNQARVSVGNEAPSLAAVKSPRPDT